MASGSKTVIYAALVGNGLIAITKFAASVFTGSSAMLTESIHSLVDTGNQGLLLYGLKRAKQPPDEDFPFGYGKEIYFWSFVVAVLIFALGAGISLYEGIKHVVEIYQDPAHATLKDPTVNYIVLSLAMIFEGGAFYFAWREFKEFKGDLGYFEAVRNGKDPTMFLVLFEDGAALTGLFIAFVGIVLGHALENPYFDGIASILIGLLLATVSLVLAYETKGLIIGESASRPVRKRIREMVEAHAGIKTLNELVAVHMGPENIIVTMSVDFDDDLTSQQVEAEIAQMNSKIREEFPDEVRRVFIEVESFAAHAQQVEAANKPNPLHTD